MKKLAPLLTLSLTLQLLSPVFAHADDCIPSYENKVKEILGVAPLPPASHFSKKALSDTVIGAAGGGMLVGGAGTILCTMLLSHFDDYTACIGASAKIGAAMGGIVGNWQASSKSRYKEDMDQYILKLGQIEKPLYILKGSSPYDQNNEALRQISYDVRTRNPSLNHMNDYAISLIINHLNEDGAFCSKASLATYPQMLSTIENFMLKNQR